MLNEYESKKVDTIKKQVSKEITVKETMIILDLTDAGVLINTCVHKEKLSELIELGNFLQNLGIDHWKLRKFYSGSGRGAVPNKDRFEMSEEQFFNMVNSLKENYPNMCIDGRLSSKLQTRLMLSPQGTLYRMIGEDENENYVYGNILEKKLCIKDIYERDNCN